MNLPKNEEERQALIAARETALAAAQRAVDRAKRLLEEAQRPPESPPSREELIDLCMRGFVPVEHWRNRDSAGAQTQLGEAFALLKAGCDFRIEDETVHDSWWVEFEYPGFRAFDEGREYTEKNTCYIPTNARLNAAEGKDWY